MSGLLTLTHFRHIEGQLGPAHCHLRQNRTLKVHHTQKQVILFHKKVICAQQLPICAPLKAICPPFWPICAPLTAICPQKETIYTKLKAHLRPVGDHLRQIKGHRHLDRNLRPFFGVGGRDLTPGERSNHTHDRLC